MNNELFRKKSLDKVRSPESLNDYIKISNASIWLVIITAILLIVGASVWGIFGYVDTYVDADVVFKDNTAVCIVDSGNIKVGMKADVDGNEAKVVNVTYGNGKSDTCEVTLKSDIADGKYTAKIITEQIHPITFVFN